MKVIGAGFGRTGTASLKNALEHLGFGPCYHMFEVVERPSRMRQWAAAATGGPVDWDQIFVGFSSTVDWPAAAFWRELADHYPAAKVILTVRDADRWYDSAARTIFKNVVRAETPASRAVFRLLNRMSPDFRAFIEMTDATVLRRALEGRVTDRAGAIELFHQHNRQVRDTIQGDRLLVFDVADGWPPLCEFLGVPIPSGVPFPNGNSTASFPKEDRRRMGRLILGTGSRDERRQAARTASAHR
ncbi:MAG TPA: sulfotransferase [Pseudonocardiaceae bacterium]|nr:sulfotransferase [Pseudonocardiaceae bacterium]